MSGGLGGLSAEWAAVWGWWVVLSTPPPLPMCAVWWRMRGGASMCAANFRLYKQDVAWDGVGVDIILPVYNPE